MATAAVSYNPAASAGYGPGSGLAVNGANLDNTLITGLAGGQIVKGGTAASEILRLESTANATRGSIKLGKAAAGNCLLVIDEANGVLYFGDPALVYVAGTTSKWIIDAAGNGDDTFVHMCGKTSSGIKTAAYFQNRGAAGGDDLQLAFNPAGGSFTTASKTILLKFKYDVSSTSYRVYLSPGNSSGTPQDVVICDGRFNVALGKPSAATNATDGFVYMPSCAGTPTGVPTDFVTGTVPMIVDTTGSKIWFRIGGSWKGVVVA